MVPLKAELTREQQSQMADLQHEVVWRHGTKSNAASLVLTNESRKLLAEFSGSMAAPAREVVRAKVLLHYADGAEVSSIKRHVGISRPSIYTC